MEKFPVQIKMNQLQNKNVTLQWQHSQILTGKSGGSFLKLGRPMHNLPSVGIQAGAKHSADDY